LVLVRFPGSLAALRRLDRIAKQVRHILNRNKGADCSIIAHSFGTLVVARVLRDHTDLEFNRIIFCGSVVPYKFPFADYQARFTALVNEVGTQDFLPVIAEVVTLGYGSTGTYGFRRIPVRDRWHNGKAHSDFLNREFCRKFLVPFLRNGEIVEDGEKEAESPPWWLWVVSTFQIKYLLIAVAVFLLWRWLATYVAPS
jgi:pimeloyl-ACP methyl ester carboxylesterase